MKEEDILPLKTFTKYNDTTFYSSYFERALKLVGEHWILFHHCEVDGDLSFIGIPDDIEDLKYIFEQSGGVWLD